VQHASFEHAKVCTGGVILGCYVGDEEGTSAFIDKKVRTWSRELEGVIDMGRKDPHGLYTAVTKSVLHKPTYTQRGLGGNAEQYKPIEDLICNKFLPSIMGRPSREIKEYERELYALPSRMGGLKENNLMDTAKPNCTEALEATSFLVEALLLKEKWSSLKHGQHFTGTATSHKAKRKEKQEEQQRVIKAQYVGKLPSDERKACENAMSLRTHYFLVTAPSAAQGTYLTPEEFFDTVAIRYGKEPVNVATYCACEPNEGKRKPYTLEHALVCGQGGNIIGRHNIVVKELKHIVATATGGSEFSVETEVWLREPCQSNLAGLRSDIQVRIRG